MQKSMSVLVKCLSFLLISNFLFSQTVSKQIRAISETWVATDALGRSLPTQKTAGEPKEDKYVGVFYFLWQGSHGNSLYDNSKIIAENPADPQFGPRYTFHWWGEPEAGYYLANDPWVIRRNLQMLSNAGVDFLYFDVTNAYTYLDVVDILCQVSLQMRDDGIPTPYICFLTYSNSAAVINQLYNDFYSRDKYKDLWFYWDGKPLIFGQYPDSKISEAASSFFTFRFSWAWTDAVGNANHWQWLDNFPQDYGWKYEGQTKVIEQLPVSIAQHPISNTGQSYSNGIEPPLNEYDLSEYTGHGLFFSEQWSRVKEIDPSVIMIAGWNEWIAQRFLYSDGATTFLGKNLKDGETYFVDAYNQEFNRDIEPMKGGHTDNLYYQMISYIRQFKGVALLPVAKKKEMITIDGNFSDWNSVDVTFKDPQGDVFHRNHFAYNKTTIYKNTTGRNDIIEARAAYDNNYIYFYAKTTDSLTSYDENNWMILFIDADTSKTTGWEGYDFAVNMEIESDSLTTISAWQSDSTWKFSANCEYRYDNNQLEIKIDRSVLNQDADIISLNFHWVDNIQKLNDITEFFVNGDSAPDRRFNYHFTNYEQFVDVRRASAFPISYSLSQNYPNPFNPTTVIQYSIPATSTVKMQIFDALGRQVAELVDAEKAPGIYSVEFDATGFASGVYFYSITAGDFHSIKKLMLVK